MPPIFPQNGGCTKKENAALLPRPVCHPIQIDLVRKIPAGGKPAHDLHRLDARKLVQLSRTEEPVYREKNRRIDS